jgi:hypothetical protein
VVETADLSLGGRPRRFCGCVWVCGDWFCDLEVSPILVGVLLVSIDIELRRLGACFSVPSDIRFLIGVAVIVRSFLISSAGVDEHIEDMPVLVADSEEPYRCQSPCTSTPHEPLTVLVDDDMRSKMSLPVEDRLDESSSSWKVLVEVISVAGGAV